MIDSAILESLKRDPGGLFAYLWELLLPKELTIRNARWHGRNAVECDRLARAVLTARGPDLPDELLDYLRGQDHGEVDVPASRPLPRAFVVLCALDEAAAHIHPHTYTRSGPGRALPPPGLLLSTMEAQRLANGFYAHRPGVGHVVPKGPLGRRSTMEERSTASGDRLDLNFTYLSVIPALGGPYTLDLACVGAADFHGRALPEGAPVGFAPIAQDGDDLLFRPSTVRGTCYLHAEPADPDLAAARAADAVVLLLDGGASLVVLPELCVPPAAVDAVRQRLRDRARTRRGGTPGLVVLGSGVSRETCPDSGRPYNECLVMTAGGADLWRQRKMNHFSMSAARMKQCHVPMASAGACHEEDVATHGTFAVRDLPDLGRVAILICEDFEQQRPADIVFTLRPDLIVVPVLDITQRPGRWTHQRAHEIARRTGARVVVADSTTLAVRFAGRARLDEVDEADAAFGLCLDGLEELRSTFVRPAAPVGGLVTATVPWNPAAWPRTDISQEAKPAVRTPRARRSR